MNPNDDQAKPQEPTADQEAALDALVAESQALGAYDAKPQVHAELREALEEARCYVLAAVANMDFAKGRRMASDALTRIDAALRAPPVVAPADETLWLWKSGDHFLAFRHLYPCFTPGGDPMTLGEPFGRAVLRHSHNREGRDEHTNDLHHRNAAQGCQLRPAGRALGSGEADGVSGAVAAQAAQVRVDGVHGALGRASLDGAVANPLPAQLPVAPDAVYIKVTRPEGYEDVHPELLLEDLKINPAFQPEVVHPQCWD